MFGGYACGEMPGLPAPSLYGEAHMHAQYLQLGSSEITLLYGTLQFVVPSRMVAHFLPTVLRIVPQDLTAVQNCSTLLW
jgi:hypothetical protein